MRGILEAPNKMSKILITGGAGFVGSHLVDKYIDLGHQVIVIDNLAHGKKENINPKAKFYKTDIRNTEEIKRIFVKEKPEILNHHAAQINARKSILNPLLDAEINILGFLNLLEAGIKNNLKKVIFASSSAVYGETEVLPTPEDYEPKQPLSPYGIDKLTAEKYLGFYFKNYGLNFVVLRYANIYGPRQDPDGEGGVIAIFSKKFFKGGNIFINGDGKQTRDFIFIDDIVSANILALEKNINEVLNIGTSKETSINKIFDLITEQTRIILPQKHIPSIFKEQRRSSLDSSLAKKKLGWEAKTSLKEGLKKTLNYFCR